MCLAPGLHQLCAGQRRGCCDNFLVRGEESCPGEGLVEALLVRDKLEIGCCGTRPQWIRSQSSWNR